MTETAPAVSAQNAVSTQKPAGWLDGPAAGTPLELRHPADPDPSASTKASAVLALGIAAVVTGPLVGGAIPATIALVLAGQARRDLVAARGFLTGARRLRLGLMLAWVGIMVAAAALVVAVVLGLLSLAGVGGQNFPDTSD